MRRMSWTLMGACAAVAAMSVVPPVIAAESTVVPTVYAAGLEGPRGLRFGPDGDLYVAEAGTGGTNATTPAMCMQVPTPVGPYTGGLTGRISKVDRSHKVTTVASGFPSTVDAMGDLIGVGDVAFLDGRLYALVSGGGCSHGNPGRAHSTGVAVVNPHTGNWSLIADIGAFLKTHPAKFESTGDFEPDGTLYSLIASHGELYTVEPNHGQVFRVKQDGDIKEIIDISASQGHIVPTSIAERDGDFFVGNLNLFQINPQWARILTISRSHDDDYGAPPGFRNDERGFHVVDSKAGFTTIVAVDFGPDGLLYVLELSDAPGFPTPGMGKVVRVKHSGEIEDVVDNLVVPTGMTFGPDGALYISNFGAIPSGAAPVGSGQILRAAVSPGW
jgi:hypothetical protein